MRLNQLHLHLLVALVGLLAGCQTMPPGESENLSPNLFWPPPPEDPRIAYVRVLRQPADVGIQPSGFSRFLGRIFGSSQSDRLVKPFGIALDEHDNLCLTDTGNQTVIFYDRQNNKWQRWDHIDKIRFAAPTAIAKTNNLLFVTDPGLGQLIAFDTDGKLRWTVRQELKHPAGLVCLDNKLYVADSHNHRIAVFDLTGKFLTAFGQRGTKSGEFNFPTHLGADSAGKLYVVDSMNNRVQVFDSAGKFLSQFGAAGDAAGYFSRPKGVAVDNLGHIYVIDANFDNFQIFDSTGRILLHVGEAGHEPGQFWLPNGIVISRQNEIFITDSYNKRVQILKYVGPS